MIASFGFAEEQAPPKADTGDTTWMIAATALVMFMTVPEPALSHDGTARRKDALNTIAMSFSAFDIASIAWVFMAIH